MGSPDARALDKLWEAWWGQPVWQVGAAAEARSGGQEGGPVAAPERRRLSLRHGVDSTAIAAYVRSLETHLIHRVQGKRTPWVPTTPCFAECFNSVRELGTGHYGTVQLCQETATGKKFACKTMLKSSLLSVEDVEELCTEILTMLGLQSAKTPTPDCLLRFHELFDEDDAVHLILDYCDGGDLLGRITKFRRLSERDAAHIFKQAVCAVLHMHSQGYIHRDLKPENILLTGTSTPRPAVRVGDFGLSLHLRPGETTRGASGSLHYAAPEVVANRSYAHKADVWSLGVVLFTCLSGRLPFWAETMEGIVGLILAAKPSFAAKPWRRVSPDAKCLVLGMLHPDPDERLSLHYVLLSDWVMRHCSCSIAAMYPVGSPLQPMPLKQPPQPVVFEAPQKQPLQLVPFEAPHKQTLQPMLCGRILPECVQQKDGKAQAESSKLRPTPWFALGTQAAA